MNPPLKILFVDNDLNSFFAYRLGVARAARAAGFEVHIAAPTGKAVSRMAAEGFTFHPLKLSRSGLKLWEEFGTIFALYRLYRQIQPDLLHHLRLKPVLYGGLAAYFARVPAVVCLLTGLGYVFTANTLRARLLRSAVKTGCRLAFRHHNQKVIFQNPDDRSIFVDGGILRPGQTVLIRGSGVDMSMFQPTPEPEGTPVVVLASRMLRDKGVVEFVDAARSLRATGVTARFVLVGDTDAGNPTAISAEQLERWAGTGAIEWWGLQEDMLSVMARCHIVCLPSLREGTPKVLIEASACGRPVVATDVPGCREIVRHRQNGLLVPAQNSAALAEALRLLIENPSVRSRMGTAGRQIAVQDFALERVVSETLGVYRELLGSVAAPAGPLKRIFDLIVSSGSLIALSPVLALVAVAVRLGSRGPIFYRGVRIGRHGEPFRIFKFRTMVEDAEKLGGSATAKDDPRITRLGHLLRRHKLDELPQLFNVLTGDMSLVGPRPEVRKYVDMYSPEERIILELRPGITDWASVWNADEAAVLEGSKDPERAYEQLIRPTKIALQIYYARRHSMLVDLRILFHTFMRLCNENWMPKELLPFGKIKRYQTVSTLSQEQRLKHRRNVMPYKDRVKQKDLATPCAGLPEFSNRFPFIRPLLPPLGAVLHEYESAYDRGIITNAEIVGRFENEVAEYLGVRHCVAVSSCTSGLTLVIRALDLAGEVIIPSFTFFATGHAARWNGLQPVFADCNPVTWNIDPSDIEKRITARTTAILAVHLYGNPCPVQELQCLAARHSLKLIFDAAHAFGSRYRGLPIGRFGDAEVFSLSPTKLLVAGEGGLVTTDDTVLAAKIRAMRNYGDSGAYDPQWLGMNARMSEFNAALGLAGLRMVDQKVNRRNDIAGRYTRLLESLPGLRFQQVHADDTHTYKDYSIHLTAEDFGMSADELRAALLEENIETKKYFFPPLHQQKLYSRFHDPVRGALTNTEEVTGGIVSLPIYESLPDETVDRIVDVIQRLALSRRKRPVHAIARALRHASAR